MGSFSEAEEKTIKAVCEQIKVWGRPFVVFWSGWNNKEVGKCSPNIFFLCLCLQPCQRNDLEGGNTASGIYETVRSEVRRAISDIQNDLETVSSYGFILPKYSWYMFAFICSELKQSVFSILMMFLWKLKSEFYKRPLLTLGLKEEDKLKAESTYLVMNLLKSLDN